MKLENLTTNDLGRHCIYLDEVDSTNEYLKREGASLPHGTLVLAGCQTAGKGRLGRRWAATDRDALAMSLLLRDFDVQRLSALPLVCGMAVAQGLREMTGGDFGIKWTNDVVAQGKKVCGILTEASFDLESSLVDSVVLGIGLNAYLPREGFPPSIAHTAGAIFEAAQPNGKNRLAAAFLNRFWDAYSEGMSGDFAARYRRRNLAIGREVQVLSPTGMKTAFALDVDDDCHLLVRYQDGSTAQLTSGEISLQL